MLYVGIDLHARQFTVNVRNESGEAVLRRQVSTAGDKPALFLAEVTRLAGKDGYVAMLEVCGFHDWLTELLPHCGCREVILIQVEQRDQRKTDLRDAACLSEVLWINRQRLLNGLPVRGVRRITPATGDEKHDRRLTQLRRKAGAERTRVLNAIQHILRRLNVAQFMPVKGIQTTKAQQWLRVLSLPPLDHFEMNQLLARWEWLDKELDQLEVQIRLRVEQNPQAMLLRAWGRSWRWPSARASETSSVSARRAAWPITSVSLHDAGTPAKALSGWDRSPNKAAFWCDSCWDNW